MKLVVSLKLTKIIFINKKVSTVFAKNEYFPLYIYVDRF